MSRVFFALCLLTLFLAACVPVSNPPAQGSASATSPDASEPTVSTTPIPEPSPTATETITPTPTLGVGSSMVWSADGMTLVYVPAGPFEMGAADGYSDERPVHTVELPAFWIDQTEMTNARYARCVEAGVCARPRRISSNVIDLYYGSKRHEDWPVIFISWQDAVDYCSWVGRRLPTEAEWEKAARGTDGRLYPWGSTPPDDTLLNFDHLLADVTATASYPEGASPYGALDLAGNVAEWVADWYAEDYYSLSPAFDPPGPETGTYRVTRGSSWKGNAIGVRSSHRYLDDPVKPTFDLGFRCAVDAP